MTWKSWHGKQLLDAGWDREAGVSDDIRDVDYFLLQTERRVSQLWDLGFPEAGMKGLVELLYKATDALARENIELMDRLDVLEGELRSREAVELADD